MRIAFINACRYLGGAELWHLAAAREFLARGHRVWMMARPGPLAERAQAEKIPTLVVPLRNDLDLFSFIQLCNFFIQEQIEVVIGNDQRDLRLAGTAAFFAGVPVRIHRKGAIHLDPGPINRFLYGRVLTHVIANSEAVAQPLRQFGFPSDRLLLFRNGVDLDRFSSAGGEAIRQEWKIPKEVPLLGCIGRLSSLKGQDDLLRAAAILRDQGLSFRLALIGSGRIESELRQLCRALELDERVIFAGQRQDIPEVIAALDLAVQPSISEAMPNSVLEAMAARKAIVATATGGIPELIADGERGLLVPPRDPPALAGAIARLLADPKEAARLAAAARAWVEERHDQKRMIDELEETLQELLEELQSPKPVEATGGSPLRAETMDSILRHRPGDAVARVHRFYLEELTKLNAIKAPDPAAKVREVRGQAPPQVRVSVILPTFNRPEMIRESIASVLRQEFQDWELIVVNDGGGREVEATLREFPDPRIRYVYAEHGGLSSALNVGQFLAAGRYFAYLDDDDIYYPDHLARLVGCLESHPDCPVAYADAFRGRQEHGPDGRWQVVERTLAFSRDFDPRAFLHQTYIPILCLVHHRECVAEVGGFNEAILHAMDWEFYLRLSRRYRFHHLAKVTGEYRVREDRDQMTTRAGVPRNYYRNLILYKHGLSPLAAARRGQSSGQGSARKFLDELGRLLDLKPELARELELRKLFHEPYYALFYSLGKVLERDGEKRLAHEAFRSARRLAPLEPKTHLAWLRSR
jgi:glycosyltransferase involved in cell wall biosynthesis